MNTTADRIALLDAIVRSSRDAIGVAVAGRHVMVNPAYLGLFGFEDADEVLGRGILDLIAESERPRVLALIQQRQRDGKAPGDYVTRGLRKDGTTFDMDVRVSVFELDGERHSLVILRDVTANQQTARALAESNEKFRLITQQALMGISIIQDERLVYVSQASADLCDSTIEEMLTWTTRDFAKVIHPDDLAFALEQATRKQRGDTDVETRYSYRLVGPTGEIKHVDQYSKTVSFGDAPADLVTFVDVTARVRAEQAQRDLEQRLRSLQKLDAMGNLAGGVAHDFNNLLTAIAAGARVALADPNAEARTRDALAEILDATERAGTLTRQLLAFGRQQSVSPQPTDVNALIERLRDMFVRLLGAEIAFEAPLAEDLGTVEIDPGQLEQALVNLATNAREAMPTGGRLTIETANVRVGGGDRAQRALHEPGPYVRIRVIDDGLGMSEATCARIFEPFFTTKSASGAPGLGLSATWGIVHQHGGWIDVESTLDGGSSFAIFLPRVDDSARARMPPPIDALPQGTEAIWLVEDDVLLRETTAALLRQLGYDVKPFASAGDALVAASRPTAAVDLLLTDIVMPHMDGCELADKLRGARPGLKVLFQSGYADGVLLERGLALDVDELLRKPYAPDVLATRVRAVLDA